MIFRFSRNLFFIFLFIMVMGLSFLLSRFFPLNHLGIIPRETIGLRGILFSPFLHGTFQHLVSNVSILAVFLFFFSQLNAKGFIIKTFSLSLLSGLATWLIGREGVHIGASGLVFALFGYLASLAFFKRKFQIILISVVIFFIYGQLIFGIFPLHQAVSWEAHLGGLVAGVLFAKLFK